MPKRVLDELAALLADLLVLRVRHERLADGDLSPALVLRGERGAVGGNLHRELGGVHEGLYPPLAAAELALLLNLARRADPALGLSVVRLL